MRRLSVVAVCLAAFAAGLSAQQPARSGAAAPARQGSSGRAAAAPAKPLDIYVLDVEGGKSTIFVTPSGQIVLIDTGNPGARDLDRITAALDSLGIKKIDYLITTHYHVDHIGAMLELAKKVQIDHFIDHGPSVEQGQQAFLTGYADLKAKAKYTQAKPGDRLPITGLDWRIVSSAGEVIKTPLPGAGGKPNPECASYVPKDPNAPDGGHENGQSVGSVITYGRFRAIDVGDLLWNIEAQLVCPVNNVGTMDVYFTTHHGLDYSGSPAFVHSIRPRVTVMQNGPRKGGAASAIQIIRTSPGMEDLWELHWGDEAGLEYNSPGMFIANVDDAATTAAVLTAPPPARGGFGGGRGGPGGPGGGAPAGVPGQPPPAGGFAPAPGASPAPGAVPGAAPAAAPAPGSAPAAPVAGAPPNAGQRGGGGRGGPQLQNAAHSPAYYIKVSAMPDGTFTVTNQRNGFSKTYTKR